MFSRHGIWTFIFRFAEMSSRVLTLRRSAAWRGWTFLLLFIDLLLITALNLPAALTTLDEPEGQHIPFRPSSSLARCRRLRGSPTQGAVLPVPARRDRRGDVLFAARGGDGRDGAALAHEGPRARHLPRGRPADVLRSGLSHRLWGFFSVVLAAAVPMCGTQITATPSTGSPWLRGHRAEHGRRRRSVGRTTGRAAAAAAATLRPTRRSGRDLCWCRAARETDNLRPQPRRVERRLQRDDVLHRLGRS